MRKGGRSCRASVANKRVRGVDVEGGADSLGCVTVHQKNITDTTWLGSIILSPRNPKNQHTLERRTGNCCEDQDSGDGSWMSPIYYHE